MELVQIVTDVTDWGEKALRIEEIPQTQDEVIALAVEKGLTARESAEIALAARAMGLAPAEVIEPDKECLGTGGGYFVHHAIAVRKQEIERNGKTMRARQYTAIVSAQEPEDAGDEGQQSFELEVESDLPADGYTELGTPESVANAERLLFRFVPGHFRNRIVEIWAGAGDVEGVTQRLIDTLRGIADEVAE